jgi:integron integrase
MENRNTRDPVKLQYIMRRKLADSKIPEGQWVFWELWIKQYLIFCDTEEISPGKCDNISKFLEYFKQKERKPWQVEQAQRAINLYLQLQPDLYSPTSKTHNYSETTSIEDNHLTSTANGSITDIAKIDNNSPSEHPLLWNKIVERVSEVIRLKHYAKHTLKHYTYWVKRLGIYCKHKDPATLHVSDVRMFLEYLAINRNVSSSQQNQAFNALLFLFKQVLNLPFEGLQSTVRAKEVKYLPEILSQGELKTLFDLLEEPYKLLAELYYGCGLRLEEGLSIRIKDVDFNRKLIIVKGKGKKDRYLPIPDTLIDRLHAQIKKVRYFHTKDEKNEEYHGVFLPDSITNKSSNFSREWGLYWLFPAPKLTYVKEEFGYKRYHIHDTVFQRMFQEAVKASGIPRRVKVHTLRHTYSTDLLAAGYDIRQVQDLLGHTDVRTTMIYTHIVRPDQKPVRSPLDLMREREKG